jgi:hypothetical protein
MDKVRGLINGGDIAALGNYLRELERETADHNKVGHLYTPTVFPFEAKTGAVR